MKTEKNEKIHKRSAKTMTKKLSVNYMHKFVSSCMKSLPLTGNPHLRKSNKK